MFRRLMRKVRSNRKAFTLVELMVVVVIIGILVAIAIPQFGGATRGAERAAVEGNLRTIDGAIMMYRAERGAFPGVPAELYGTDRYLLEWPTGPGTAQYNIYSINDQMRAVVSGEVGGEELTTDNYYTLERLPW